LSVQSVANDLLRLHTLLVIAVFTVGRNRTSAANVGSLFDKVHTLTYIEEFILGRNRFSVQFAVNDLHRHKALGVTANFTVE